MRDLALEVLRGQGYTVLSTRHGADALLTAEQHAGTIDLLLTDVVMPGMSGVDLAERLTALRPGLRVLFVSGYAGDRLGQRRYSGDPSELLKKPFTPEVLLKRVRRVFDAG